MENGNGFCKTVSEELLWQTNRKMIYADKAYYDFLLPIKFSGKPEFPHYIKIESLLTNASHNPFIPSIYFKIRKGNWLKIKKADFIVALTPREVYYGPTAGINEYIQRNLPESVKENSWRPNHHGGKGNYFLVKAIRLIKSGLIKSIPITRIHELESLIQEEYDCKTNK